VRTFIVRLLEDAGGLDQPGPAAPRLKGVVDEVATGLRAVFRNDAELLAALLAAMSAGQDGGDRDVSAPD
jgi:hypothetical protein